MVAQNVCTPIVVCPALVSKFLKHCIKNTTGCWGWRASTNNGYSVICHDKRVLRAHRVSYAIHHGDIPNGMIVCHRCDNPRCTNPDHLFLGTISDNAIDCVRKGRRGKLSPKDAAYIKSSSESACVLARRFGLEKGYVRQIKRGLTWWCLSNRKARRGGHG